MSTFHMSPYDADQLQLMIELHIEETPGHRLHRDAIRERIQRGLVPGDLIRSFRTQNTLSQYNGDGTVTVIYQEVMPDETLRETGRMTKPVTEGQCRWMLARAAITAHAEAIQKPSGVHHAFTGTAYNPVST